MGVVSSTRHRRGGLIALTMVTPSTVSRNDDIGRLVSFAEHIVVGGHEVLQGGWKSVLRDGGETIARRDEHAFAHVSRVCGDGTEQLDVKFDERWVGGVADNVAPAMDEEGDVGVCDVRSRLGLKSVVVEGEEIYGDALRRL